MRLTDHQQRMLDSEFDTPSWRPERILEIVKMRSENFAPTMYRCSAPGCPFAGDQSANASDFCQPVEVEQ